MKERKVRCECVVKFRGGISQSIESIIVEEVSGTRRSLKGTRRSLKGTRRSLKGTRRSLKQWFLHFFESGTGFYDVVRGPPVGNAKFQLAISNQR